jgi:hypothetical protein
MVSPVDCPFLAGPAITDPRFFVGRQESLKILCDRLTGAQPISINIVGRHRTGKSSLLLHFVNTYRQRVENPDRFMVVYLSLQSAACDSQEKFYRAITKAFLGNIPSGATAEIQQELQIRLREQDWEQLKFNDLIQYLKEQSILPVLCVDNFEELLERQEKFPNDFYDNLRFLIDSNYLMLIMASCERLDDYSRTKRITSDFFNIFQSHNLNEGLTQTEAEELVAFKNSSGKQLKYELQQKALTWGKQEPYLLQLAAQTLWEVEVSDKTLESASKNFKEQAKRVNFQPKSPLLSILYKFISAVGQGCLWFVQNFENNKKFLFGLFVLLVLFFIVLSLAYRLPIVDLIKAIAKKLFG